MSRVFICSDTHFGHENMARKRGFISSEEHDHAIITNWNKAVHKHDKVYVLGDLTMEKKNYSIFGKLNGTKVAILGNHDLEQDGEQLRQYFSKIAGCVKYKKKFWLTHIPIHPIELRGLKNCHGHCHENSIPDENYINVCMEMINYTPVLIESFYEQG